MTEQQQTRAIDSILTAAENLATSITKQIEVFQAHLDLIRNLNDASIQPPPLWKPSPPAPTAMTVK